LVVEADEAVRSVLRREFRLEGFVLWEAASAEGAIEVFCRRTGSVGLVLVDAGRPPWLDGLLAARAIRELRPDVPLAFMITCDLGERHNELEALGPVALFHKPFWPRDMVNVLGSLLR